MPSRRFDPILLRQLRDPALAAEYLSVALQEATPDGFLIALRNVAEARGGMSELARATELNRQNMYRSLSEGGNPTLTSLLSILGWLGLRLAVEPTDDAAA